MENWLDIGYCMASQSNPQRKKQARNKTVSGKKKNAIKR